MIKGTNCDCKIIKIEISGSKAYITCLLFATAPTYPSIPFRFYIQNKDSDERQLASITNYWIDRVNSYTNDSQNCSVNKYKEVRLEIDITDSNTSSIKEMKWVRQFYIELIRSDTSDTTVSWCSELLTTMSKQFELPSIKNIQIYTKDTNTEGLYNIVTECSLSYESQSDFNYSNSNLSAYVKISSAVTGKEIENSKTQITMNGLKINNKSLFDYEVNAPIKVTICICNLKGDVLISESRHFVPEKKYSHTYVKTKNGIRQVIAVYKKISEGVEQ